MHISVISKVPPILQTIEIMKKVYLLLLILCCNKVWAQIDTLYSTTGAIIATGQYKDSLRHGAWTTWEEGVRKEGNYVKGYQSGIWIYTYPNGNIKEVGNFYIEPSVVLISQRAMEFFLRETPTQADVIEKDSVYESGGEFDSNVFGDTDGNWVFFSFANFECIPCKDGIWLEFDESGALIKEVEYDKGEIVEED